MGISCWCGGGKPRTTSAHELLKLLAPLLHLRVELLTRILCLECLKLSLLCSLLRYLPRRSSVNGWAWWTSVHPLHPLLLHWLKTLVPLLYLLWLLESTTQPTYTPTGLHHISRCARPHILRGPWSRSKLPSSWIET